MHYELVSLITFGNLRKVLGSKANYGDYELLRFVNKIGINNIGGFSKLLSFFTKTYKPNTILTYSDKRWSGFNHENTVYHKNGFKYMGNTKPNYWYVKIGEYTHRHHRFSFRKDILVKEGYDKKLTELEIMKIKGYDRIWDCGSMKFEFTP